jgi:single-strand DNA-binding protein
MYLNRVTLVGFIGNDAERKVANATNIAIFSIPTNTSWKNDAGSWESRTEWHRCVAFGKLADFAGTLTKGAHAATEGELRSHEYQRELALRTQKNTLAQRVGEIGVDSVLKLDRAAKAGADENRQEVPRQRASPWFETFRASGHLRRAPSSAGKPFFDPHRHTLCATLERHDWATGSRGVASWYRYCESRIQNQRGSRIAGRSLDAILFT